MNDKTKALDDFESPTEHAVEIEIDGAKKTYLIAEVDSVTMQDLVAPLNATDEKKKAEALRTAQARLISACVKREDGTAITFDEASKFRTRLAKRLEREAMNLNGFNEDADVEAKK